MNIAVTGGMGSGKSMVCQALAEVMGATRVSADDLCRDLLTVGNPGWQRMQETFSGDFFLKDGSVNRPVLRQAIFSNSALREKLDAILHPLVRKELFALFSVSERQGNDLVAEVPLLFEKGWQGDFDYTLVVFAAEEVCVARIMERDLVTEDDALTSIASQMPLDEKLKLADWVIDNSGPFAQTLEQINRLEEKISARQTARRKAMEG